MWRMPGSLPCPQRNVLPWDSRPWPSHPFQKRRTQHNNNLLFEKWESRKGSNGPRMPFPFPMLACLLSLLRGDHKPCRAGEPGGGIDVLELHPQVGGQHTHGVVQPKGDRKARDSPLLISKLPKKETHGHTYRVKRSICVG